MSERQAQSTGERLAKVIARAGVCSRRDAEYFIQSGRVSVNGQKVQTPAFNVVDSDKIAVDGEVIARREATQAWLYHKPAGLMVTEKDPEGRPTVFDEFAHLGLPRVMTVGRLDYNTEGLLILTNDGGLKRILELPATGWVRRYRVRAFGSITQAHLDSLKDGITVDGIEYGPVEAELDVVQGANCWISIALREGKNREVRNILGALGLEVNRLIRLSYGPFQLGDLPVGAVEKVKTRILQDQLGTRLAEASGVDFDGEGAEGNPMEPRRRTRQQADESRVTERDRFGGLRKRPDFKRPDKLEERPRVVHFDDGTPSTMHTPVPEKKRRDGDDRPFKRDGDRPQRSEGRPSFGGDRPQRSEGGRSFGGDRPQRSEGGRSFGGDRPQRSEGGRSFGGDRPQRSEGGRSFGGDRPQRSEGRPSFGGDRPQRSEGRPSGGRDGKPSGGRPSGGRPGFGGKPPAGRSFSKGPSKTRR